MSPPGGPQLLAEPAVADDLELLDDLEWADDARLADVAIRGSSLVGGTVRGVSLSGARLTGVQLTGSTFEGADLVDVVLEDCELSGVTLTGARLRRVVMRRCRLSGLVAAELHAADLQVVDSKADEAWLRMSVLDRCAFVNCDLTGSDWYRAKLAATRFVRCRLDGSELSQASFDEVALHGSTLEGVRGAGAFRGLVIGSDQVADLALPLFGALSIRIDDDYLDV